MGWGWDLELEGTETGLDGRPRRPPYPARDENGIQRTGRRAHNGFPPPVYNVPTEFSIFSFPPFPIFVSLWWSGLTDFFSLFLFHLFPQGESPTYGNRKRKRLAFEISYEGVGGEKHHCSACRRGRRKGGKLLWASNNGKLWKLLLFPFLLIVSRERHFFASFFFALLFFAESSSSSFPFLALCVRTHEKPLLPTHSRGERGRNMALACMPSFPKFNIWSCAFKN